MTDVPNHDVTTRLTGLANALGGDEADVCTDAIAELLSLRRQLAERDALTVTAIEKIILSTEVEELSDRGDKIWTRRMAVALHKRLCEEPQ